MAVFTQLHKAKLDDFDILVDVERNSSGKKIALHEYPNSNKRFAEEMGNIPPTFNLTIIIHGSINRRLSFETVLNRRGLRKLIHPIYGTIMVMVGAWDASSSNSRIGEFSYSVTFYVSEQNLTATPDQVDSSQVSNTSQEARDSVTAAMADSYKTPTFADSAIDLYNKISEALSEVIDKVGEIKDVVSENQSLLNSGLEGFLDSLITYIFGDGTTMAQLFSSITSLILDVVNDPSDLYDLWRSFADFGNDDSDIEPTTVKRQEIIDNRNLINSAIQMMSLIGLYESSVYSAFETDVELLARQEILSNLFDEIARTQIENSNVIAEDQDVITNIYKLRDESRQVFNSKLQNIWRVVEIERQRSSMFLVTYRYYNSIDNLDTIINLNPELNVAGFDSALKAVSK